MCKFNCEYKFSFHMGEHLGVELLGHVVSVWLFLQETFQTVFQSFCAILHTYSNASKFYLLHILTHVSYYRFSSLLLAILMSGISLCFWFLFLWSLTILTSFQVIFDSVIQIFYICINSQSTCSTDYYKVIWSLEVSGSVNLSLSLFFFPFCRLKQLPDMEQWTGLKLKKE